MKNIFGILLLTSALFAADPLDLNHITITTDQDEQAVLDENLKFYQAESIRLDIFVKRNGKRVEIPEDAYSVWSAWTDGAPTTLYINDTGTVFSVSAGTMRHELTPAEANLSAGTYKTQVQLFEGTTRMGVIASGDIVVSYSPSGASVVYTGPTGAVLSGVTLTNWISAGTVTGLDASDITVDASGFSGNLSTADTDAQKALVTIDSMASGGDLTGVLVTGGNLTISDATGPVPSIGLTSGQIITAAGVANYLPLAGGALSGALTTSSTIDGRTVSTDGTKLDTIAENADVTFTALPGTTKGDVIMYNGSTYIRLAVGTDTHVLTADSGEASGVKWAAGGDGDLTEVQVSGGLLTVTSGTGPVPVVGVTTAAVQAATAIYLPLTGGALSGALTTSSTIDGRTVSTDGTKLDTIDENADVTFTALPGTTKGDVVMHNGSTYVRLGVGDDDQVLTADSGEASGVKWAAAGGGGSSPLTTKGDIIARTATTDVRLPVGSNGQMLTAKSDASDGTGLKWAPTAKAITRVTLTGLSAYTSTATTDTFYLWNDASASQNLQITLPEVDDDYTGLRLTFMHTDTTDHGYTLEVVPHAGDKIYDNYDQSYNGYNGNTAGMHTYYTFYHLTFINVGNGEWITSQDTAGGYWEGMSE